MHFSYRYYTDEQKEEARKEQQRRRSAIFQRIVETLRAKGAEVVIYTYKEPTYNHTEWDIKTVNGETISHRLVVKFEACVHNAPKEWSMGRASRLALGWKGRQFIEGKAGFKYEEIADAFIEMAKKDKDERELNAALEVARESSKAIKNRLTEQFQLHYGNLVRLDMCQVDDHICLHVTQTLTIDEALGLLTTLKETGTTTKINLQIEESVTEPVAAAALKWADQVTAARKALTVQGDS